MDMLSLRLILMEIMITSVNVPWPQPLALTTPHISLQLSSFPLQFSRYSVQTMAEVINYTSNKRFGLVHIGDGS
jgi:hypothetical protein